MKKSDRGVRGRKGKRLLRLDGLTGLITPARSLVGVGKKEQKKGKIKRKKK
jgi:hypothetical protein